MYISARFGHPFLLKDYAPLQVTFNLSKLLIFIPNLKNLRLFHYLFISYVIPVSVMLFFEISKCYILGQSLSTKIEIPLSVIKV